MTTYTHLTNDEKAQIKIAAKRSLEYQMYALEVEVIVENSRTTPDETKLDDLADQIAEKQAQIAAIGA
jgi:hypothetical protein